MNKEIGSGRKYSFANMLKSSLEDTREVNQVLLVEFTIQEDVKMYIQSPDYDDFLDSDLSSEADLTSISKRIWTIYESAMVNS